MEDNGDIAMWIVAWGEAVWLCVVVATRDEKVKCVYQTICIASYASSPENPMAGLTVAYGPLLVDRRECRPILGDGQ
jgi:hypothetical protein